jgi:monofunctional biosynthetic peptidoglycan transglycosylase
MQLALPLGAPATAAPLPEAHSPISAEAPQEPVPGSTMDTACRPVDETSSPSIRAADAIERAPDPQPSLADGSDAAAELRGPEPLQSDPPPRAARVTFPALPAAVVPALPPAPAAGARSRARPLTEVGPWTAPRRPAHPRRRAVARAVRGLALLAAAVVLMVVALIALYRFVDPPFSAFMAQRWLAGEEAAQTWVPLKRISPHLVQAVIVSEDGRFCQHWGVDLKELEDALERAREGAPRGASTISMQVAKNLFLWPAKSYVRKAIELPLTFGIELLWPKRRILEVYLNVAEWGPGVFGAEAASRHHFGKSAARLGEREAALLAVSLPDPRNRHASAPGPGLSRLATIIQLRMRSAGDAAACIVARKPKDSASKA